MSGQSSSCIGDPRASWFKCYRSPEALELAIGFPIAFALLYMIAYRARRTSGFNRHLLQPGEALLGDYAKCGMTEKQYRTAKKQLAEWGFASFRPTHRGTIATLSNIQIFDINAENRADTEAPQRANCEDSEQATNQPLTPNGSHFRADSRADAKADEGRTKGGRRATNKNDKNEKKGLLDTRAQGARAGKQQPKFPPEIHERAVELFEAWRDCWSGDMGDTPLDLDFARDARALHSLAGVCNATGALLPVSEIIGVVRWAWEEHKSALNSGRTDFVLEQSLTPLRAAPRFSELLVRKRNGFNSGKELDRAKSNMASLLNRQKTARRIELDRSIAEWEERMRELHETLSLGGGTEQERAEREQLKEQIAEARQERSSLVSERNENDEKRNETRNENEDEKRH